MFLIWDKHKIHFRTKWQFIRPIDIWFEWIRIECTIEMECRLVCHYAWCICLNQPHSYYHTYLYELVIRHLVRAREKAIALMKKVEVNVWLSNTVLGLQLIENGSNRNQVQISFVLKTICPSTNLEFYYDFSKWWISNRSPYSHDTHTDRRTHSRQNGRHEWGDALFLA